MAELRRKVVIFYYHYYYYGCYTPLSCGWVHERESGNESYDRIGYPTLVCLLGFARIDPQKTLALSYFSRSEYFATFENSPLKQENVFW